LGVSLTVIDEDSATYACVVNEFATVQWFQCAETFLGQLKDPTVPAVIVADVRLPGMDGVELVQRLRDLGHSAAVVLVCEDADVATAVDAIRHGADDFLEKPISHSMLVNRIRRLLRDKKPQKLVEPK